MARATTSVGTSFIISALVAGALVSGVMVFQEDLGNSDRGRILGGFLCSLIYLFILTAIGNFYVLITGTNKPTKIFEAAISLIIAEFIAGSIHGVCVTTCFLISIGITYELHKLALENGDDASSEPDRFITSKKKPVKK